jgi:serine/threonine-protein kinase HipA
LKPPKKGRAKPIRFIVYIDLMNLRKSFKPKKAPKNSEVFALTFLGHVDGEDHTEGVSYLELVDFITTKGANVHEDLEQLWRRIVFNICVSNTDDHLRNHGFILTDRGWILSPAYDINPVETGTGLKFNISENDNALDLNLAIEVCPYFRLRERTSKRNYGRRKDCCSKLEKDRYKTWYISFRTRIKVKSFSTSRTIVESIFSFYCRQFY